MEILSAGLRGLATFASTWEGAMVILVALIGIIRALIKFTPTQVDDKLWAKYADPVIGACKTISEKIKDGQQIKALDYIDKVTTAIAEGGAVDVSNEKLMTTIKKMVLKVAKESTKVNTSKEALKELKN